MAGLRVASGFRFLQSLGGGSAINVGTLTVPADTTGVVTLLTSSLGGVLTFSKVSGSTNVSVSSAGAVSLSAALSANDTNSFIARVQNATGDAIERSITLRAVALPVAPTLGALTVAANAATVGSSFNTTVNGKTANSVLSLGGAGAAGLSISGNTISGTPTAAGPINLIETLTGATNSPRTTSGLITVSTPAVTLGALGITNSSGTVNSAYSGNISGKTSGSTLSLTGAGSSGLTISGTTLSGTPTVDGPVNIVETLAGATNSPRTTSNLITIAVAPIVITLDALSVSPPTAVIGTAYNGTVVGNNADSTLTLSGAGAAGLSISGNVITGTPTTGGPVNITETLAGATNSPRTTSSPLTVAATATLNALSVVPTTSTVGTAYNGTISGKTSGSTLALSGAGAAGLTLSGNKITGTPTASGPVNIVETLSGASNSPRTNSNAVAVSVAQSAPLKAAALQNRIPSAADSGGGTRTKCGFRWPLIVACDNSSLVLDLCASWLTDYNGTGIATWDLEGLSLEDMTTNTIVPITFGGSQTVTVPGGTIRLASDEIPASAFGLSFFPQGRVYNVKGIARVASGTSQLPLSQRTTSDGGGAQVWWYDPAVTTLSSVYTSGAFTATGTAANAVRNGFCPILRGRHVRPTTAFLGLGDSIMEITADSSNNFYGRAFFQRAMHDGTGAAASMRPSILGAKVGIQTDGLTRSAFWKVYLDAIDVVISEPLTNDLGTAQTDVAGMQKLLSDLYAEITPYGKDIYQTNWTPRTNTTDDWKTQAGQTPRAAWVTGGTRDQVISWLATKVADGTLKGVIDTLSATSFPGGNGMPADNSKWDTFGPGTTTEGTRITSDGTHPYGSAQERMAVKVRQAIAQYKINGL